MSNSVALRFHLFRLMISCWLMILLRYGLTNFCWWNNYEYYFMNKSVVLRLDFFGLWEILSLQIDK